LPESLANGPGRRAVIWVRGCSLGCPGCFNPETHPFDGGEHVEVDDLVRRLARLERIVEGVTISGGEPLQQRRSLADLLRKLRAQTRLSVIVLTGFSWEEVQAMPDAWSFLASIDVLITGRFDERQRVAAGLLGSRNKTMHFLTGRYSVDDLSDVPSAEVILTGDGEVVLSGIDPLRW
jgi:anaerobic ribonucleoside-triphosphate reductase activating protein